jgi:hypothetical protein
MIAAFFRPGAEIEESQIAAGRGDAVAIEEVIGRHVVLVHGLLDQPQAHDACIKGDVAWRVGGNGGQMMDAGELHDGPRPGCRLFRDGTRTMRGFLLVQQHRCPCWPDRAVAI